MPIINKKTPADKAVGQGFSIYKNSAVFTAELLCLFYMLHFFDRHVIAKDNKNIAFDHADTRFRVDDDIVVSSDADDADPITGTNIQLDQRLIAP